MGKDPKGWDWVKNDHQYDDTGRCWTCGWSDGHCSNQGTPMHLDLRRAPHTHGGTDAPECTTCDGQVSKKIKQDTSSNWRTPGAHELTTDGRCLDCEEIRYDRAKEAVNIQQDKDNEAMRAAINVGILTGYSNAEAEADASEFFSGYAEDPFDVVPQFDQDAKAIADGLVSLLLSKHKDYGPGNIADAPGGPLNGLRVRMHDKLARINHLIDSGASPEHESLRDSFKDLANYGIIALMVLDGTWPQGKGK